MRSWFAMRLGLVGLLALLAVVLIGLSHVAAGSVAACHGSLKPKSKRKASFAIHCDHPLQPISGFDIKANKKLANVRDPKVEYSCSRTGPKSFHCDAVHSFAPEDASGVLKTVGELCPVGHSRLKVKVKADHPTNPSTRFTLAGPC